MKFNEFVDKYYKESNKFYPLPYEIWNASRKATIESVIKILEEEKCEACARDVYPVEKCKDTCYNEPIDNVIEEIEKLREGV